jgi:hypothetical protein
MKNLFDQCFRKVKFAIYILGGSIVLVLSGCQSPFPTKDVVECPIAEEQSSRFELVSTKYRNFYPLSFHVSEFSRPSGFKVFFKKGSFMGVDTEVPVWFGREWYKPWGMMKAINIVKASVKVTIPIMCGVQYRQLGFL